MGSIEKGLITGFLCRLCSKITRIVIHVNSNIGIRKQLYRKIKGCLGIEVNDYNQQQQRQLPKTVCLECINRLEEQYLFVQKLKRSQCILNSRMAARLFVSSTTQVNSTEITPAISSTSLSNSRNSNQPHQARNHSQNNNTVSPTSQRTNGNSRKVRSEMYLRNKRRLLFHTSRMSNGRLYGVLISSKSYLRTVKPHKRVQKSKKTVDSSRIIANHRRLNRSEASTSTGIV